MSWNHVIYKSDSRDGRAAACYCSSCFFFLFFSFFPLWNCKRLPETLLTFHWLQFVQRPEGTNSCCMQMPTSNNSQNQLDMNWIMLFNSLSQSGFQLRTECLDDSSRFIFNIYLQSKLSPPNDFSPLRFSNENLQVLLSFSSCVVTHKQRWLIASLTLQFSPSISSEKKIAPCHTTATAPTYRM